MFLVGCKGDLLTDLPQIDNLDEVLTPQLHHSTAAATTSSELSTSPSQHHSVHITRSPSPPLRVQSQRVSEIANTITAVDCVTTSSVTGSGIKEVSPLKKRRVR
jgi:hypothetical protein